MADYSLLVNIEAIDKASAIFDKLQGNVKRFKDETEGMGASMQSLGKGMSSAGKLMSATLTAPVIGLGAAAVKTTADFDTAMSQVAAVSGATGDELDQLREKAREMGAKTKFSASEAAEAMNYMAMAGWKTEDMLNGIEGIMNLAAASGESLGTTSDIVTDALTAFGLTAADSAHFADILAAASSSANTNVSMMGETFKYVAPVAGALGYSAEDTAEAIGIMANSGIKASQAGTALRSIISRIATDAGASSKSLGALGILTEELGVEFYESGGQARELGDVLTDAREAWSKLTEEEQVNYANKIAGMEGTSAWMALMNASSADVEKLSTAISTCSDSMGSYDGAAEQMAAVMQDNLEGQLTFLKSQLQELAISFGEFLVPVIREGVGILQQIIDKFNSLSPEAKETIVKIAAITAAVGPLLIVGGKLVSGIGTLISVGSKVKGLVSGIGSSAAAAAAPVSSAGSAVGTLTSNALGFIALGAGILLAAAGLALLAQSAIAISDAGAPAAIAMGAMVLVIAGLAAGAAALAPALTAGAVGLVAFGAAVAAVGVGILAMGEGVNLACQGVSTLMDAVGRLTEKLPTVAEYGGEAAAALLEISGGAVALGASASACGISLAAFALEAGGADLALVAFDVEMGIAVPIVGALDLALVAMLGSITKISDATESASKSMKDIEGSMNIVKTGISGLGDMFTDAVDKIIKIFNKNTDKAEDAGRKFSKGISDGTEKGLSPIAEHTQTAMTTITFLISKSGTKIQTSWSTVLSNMATNTRQKMSQISNTLQNNLEKLQKMFANTKFSFNQSIALPHFTMTGNFDPKTGSVPTVGVEWYANSDRRSYDFESPTSVGESSSDRSESSQTITTSFGERSIYINHLDGRNEDDIDEFADMVVERISDKIKRKDAAF